MGYGDAIMATAKARGMHAQGKLMAFGDKVKIKWTGYCEQVFKNNPNIARPGQERQSNVIWVEHYKRGLVHSYCTWDDRQRRYHWNYKYKAMPGEFFFAAEEYFPLLGNDRYIVIEPNVAWQ